MVEYRCNKNTGGIDSALPGSGLIVYRLHGRTYPLYVYRPGGTYTYPLGVAQSERQAFFSLESGRPELMRLQVFNVRGQLVRTLKDGSLEFGAGSHSVVWNGDDDNGRSMSSGVYFYRLETSVGREVRRMLLMK